MADFTVTYTSGGQATLTADRFRESGQWIVFEADGREDVILSADAVRSIERTDPPDPPRLDRASRAFVVVLLVSAGALLLALGIFDAFSALTVSARVLGGAMAAAGLGCVVGAQGAFSNEEKGLRRALAGSVAALVAGVIVLGMQFAGDGQTTPLTYAALAFVVAAGAAAVRLRVAGVKPELPTPVRGFVAAGVVVTLVQFWYTNEYLPATREAGFTELVDLVAGPIAPGRTVPEFVTATITLKNVSGTKVRVVGSHYEVSGIADDGRPQENPLAGSLSFGDTNWLGPGEEYVERLVFRLTEGSQRVIRMTVDVHVVKGQVRLHRREPDEVCEEAGCSNAWRISESSELRRRTREARYVVQDRDGGLATCILRAPGPCPADQPPEPAREAEKLGALYGRVIIGASTQLALPPVPAPPAPAPPVPAPPAPASTAAAPPGSPP